METLHFIDPMEYLAEDTFLWFPRLEGESENKWRNRINSEGGIDSEGNFPTDPRFYTHPDGQVTYRFTL